MFKRTISFLLLSLILLPTLYLAEDKPVITVSILPVQTFVQKVVGNKADVFNMIPPGASPETFDPSPIDKQNLNLSKLYFSIGVPAEVINIIPYLNKETKLVELDKIVAEKYEDYTIDGGRDPHIWLSPKRVIVMVDNIAKTMMELDPENSIYYRQNANNYIQELEALDIQIKDNFKAIKNNKVIAFHPAFQYFTKDYGLELFSLEEHGKEATPQHLQNMLDFSHKENIKVIFYQSEISSRQAMSFAEEIGGEAIMLNPLSENYIENLLHTSEILAEVLNR